MQWFVGLALLVQAGISLAAPYYGRLIGNFQEFAHKVSGTVRGADSKTIVIENFIYDGAGPDTFIWVGTTASPDVTGTIVPVVSGTEIKLDAYSGEMVTVTLPGSMTVQDYKWISIWCRQFAANFGQVIIPSDFSNPASTSLGQLPTYAHSVRADNVQVEDAKTLTFTNLHYDGNAPDAYFWGDTRNPPTTGGIKLIWKPGQTNAGRNQRIEVGFNGETVTVTMPEGMTVYDFRSFGLWCVPARQDFGSIGLNPTTLNVPAVLAPPSTFSNCKVLVDDEFQVTWRVNEGDDSITVELAGRVTPGHYLAFGLSGSDTSSLMDGSDVVVAWVDEQSMNPMVVDYNLESKAQCSINDGRGACPDDTTSVNGANNVMLRDMLLGDGVTRISYTRPLNTGDAVDKVIPTDREVYISWAVGFINPDGRVAKHVNAPTNNPKVNFGRASSTCLPFQTSTGGGSNLPPWPALILKDETRFRVEIGQSGGERGYTGVTGTTGWGIAWYVNELLIPEITVKRGVNYSFEVFGGIDAENSAQYHPFYITNDDVGGYIQKTDAQKRDTIIYAGPTVGPFCNWQESESGISPNDYSSFAAYKTKLERRCAGANTTGGKMYWVPDDYTPNVVYYQCYTHRFLGWKINVISAAKVLPPWPALILEDETRFRVEIGQSGGERGYTGVTGTTGWGIAWYVNELLIPEITVKRGVNYSFEVFGGIDAENSAQYHPFYITNDDVGGYIQKTDAQKRDTIIYAGPTVGPFCVWQESVSGISPNDYSSFADYKTKLERRCAGAKTNGGKMYWVPDDNTPNVVYYQCYTHRFLGWKINVTCSSAAEVQISLTLLLAMLGVASLL